MILNILNLIDDVKCFETVRQMRWPDGVTCPQCASPRVTKQGHDEAQPVAPEVRVHGVSPALR